MVPRFRETRASPSPGRRRRPSEYLLGYERHSAGQERDDVQVPEPHEREVHRQPGLLELQERVHLGDSLDRRSPDVRHAREQLGQDVLLYLCAAGDPTNCTGDPTQSKYYDFIEHTIGATQYNGNTTRVDAFGLKIAMRLHCADGYDVAVGEDYETFLEDRAATFQKFLNEVPAEFQELAQAPNAPYRIVEPGAGQFKTGGTYADYYDDFVNQMWANNGLTIAKPGPNGSGLASYPDVSAAIFRHVGDKAGSFTAAGKLMDKTLWSDSTTFYTAAPANYYARFWHTHALNGKAYGFPYDDVGGYSSYISHANPQYMLVAIGW